MPVARCANSLASSISARGITQLSTMARAIRVLPSSSTRQRACKGSTSCEAVRSSIAPLMITGNFCGETSIAKAPASMIFPPSQTGGSAPFAAAESRPRATAAVKVPRIGIVEMLRLSGMVHSSEFCVAAKRHTPPDLRIARGTALSPNTIPDPNAAKNPRDILAGGTVEILEGREAVGWAGPKLRGRIAPGRKTRADVVELADTPDLGSGPERGGSSSLPVRTSTGRQAADARRPGLSSCPASKCPLTEPARTPRINP